MDKYEGKIQLKQIKAGSKSDGTEVYLICNKDQSVYKLYRPDMLPINDPLLIGFEDENVIVHGEVQQDEWLKVEEIEKVSLDNESEND